MLRELRFVPFVVQALVFISTRRRRWRRRRCARFSALRPADDARGHFPSERISPSHHPLGPYLIGCSTKSSARSRALAASIQSSLSASAEEVVVQLHHPSLLAVIKPGIRRTILEVTEDLPRPVLHAVQHLEDAGFDGRSFPSAKVSRLAQLANPWRRSDRPLLA